MDTVVSRSGTPGGLLVLLDRCGRRCVVEHLGHVSQDEVVRAVRRMKARNALPTVNSLTRRQIRDLEAPINSIHRESPDGETAYAYDSRLAQTS